jgi:hypothetical protein
VSRGHRTPGALPPSDYTTDGHIEVADLVASRNWSLELRVRVSGRARRFSGSNAASKLTRRDSRSPKPRCRNRRPATRPKLSAGRSRRNSAAGSLSAERACPLGIPPPLSHPALIILGGQAEGAVGAARGCGGGAAAAGREGPAGTLVAARGQAHQGSIRELLYIYTNEMLLYKLDPANAKLWRETRLRYLD